jgi:uracil-DNA glycosylase
MHTITKQEDALFAKWAAKRPQEGFYKDGIFDPEQYGNSTIKTVFILREANLPTGTNKYDLREVLQTCKTLRWWVPKLSRWCHGLSNYHIDTRNTWKDTITDCFAHREALRPFGFIQLKKKPGKEQSNPIELREYAEKDKAFIRQQLAIYKPDVIIACGLGSANTFNLLLDTVFENASEEPKLFGDRQYVRLFGQPHMPDGIHIIETYHPSARKSREYMYNQLIGLFRHVAKERET